MDKVQHPLQSFEWGEFRKLTGVKVVREGGIQVTIHKIPWTPWNIGYAPKTEMIDERMRETLEKIARENNCICIKLEPRVEGTWSPSEGFVVGRPLFTKYNFVLNVSPSETELLSSCKPKTRYNIRVAEKHGVKVEIDNSEEAFAKYLELTEETTKRQRFYAHGRKYHQKMWQVLHKADIAQLLVARYQGEIITTWVLFKYGDTLYYPYGASTRAHREVMANNLVMWEAIRLAKKWGLKYLDMWGALGPDADP
ncbi:MAG: FemAB family protein, partial [Microgenomates group bacterium GW2011_GWA2_46_7]